MTSNSKLFVLAAGWLLLAGCGESPLTRPGPATDAGARPPDPVGSGLAALVLESDSRGRFEVTGRPLTGSDQLEGLTGHNAFWFAWSVFHPDTDVFGSDADIRDAVVDGSGECSVPCEEILPACSGRDCIPSLQSPEMVGVGGPNLDFLEDDDEVLGVITPSGPRAYPHNILWWHEIVNEEVDGLAFTVTFCPLTGSGLAFDRRGFVEGETVELGISGNLYNSNLVMYDRTTESFWSQMRLEAIAGSERGAPSPLLPVFEMTWGAWRTLHPDTRVVSSATGFSRDYRRYPYGDFRTNDANTFRVTNPTPDAQFENKDMVFGLLLNGERRAYLWSSLEEASRGSRGVVHDTLGGLPLVIVHDLAARYVHAFRANAGERFELVER